MVASLCLVSDEGLILFKIISNIYEVILSRGIGDYLQLVVREPATVRSLLPSFI